MAKFDIIGWVYGLYVLGWNFQAAAAVAMERAIPPQLLPVSKGAFLTVIFVIVFLEVCWAGISFWFRRQMEGII